MENSEKIFNSCLKLTYCREEIELEHKIKKEQLISKYIKVQTIVVMLISLGATVGNSFFYSDWGKTNFKGVLFTSYISSFLYVIFTIILLFTNNISFKKFMNYLNYYLLFYSSINLRYPLVIFLNLNPTLFYSLLCAELMMRLSWVLLEIQGFYECLLLNTLNIASLWLIYATIGEASNLLNTMMLCLTYSVSLLLLVFYSYFFEKQYKKAFYLQYMTDKKATWLQNVLENMNTGFLSLKGEKMAYVNSCMMKIIAHNKCIKENIEHLTTQETHTFLKVDDKFHTSLLIANPNSLLHSLLSTINTESLIDTSVARIILDFKEEYSSLSEKKLFLNSFIKYIEKLPQISNFVLIGDTIIQCDDDLLDNSFEVYCRYNKTETDFELDFLFNDVTRTKTNEKQKLELQYKTLFLSKVAHEFKNPLICITELIDQLQDPSMLNFKDQKFHNFDNIFNIFGQIKAMSNFLLFLVKDLDYFSRAELGHDLQFINSETDIDELLKFSRDIALSLLNKSNKSKEIQFKIKINNNIPKKIITDESKLKQVLVNLISNAVKFTLYGKIVLRVSQEIIEGQNFIKFLVKDTGQGIKEENKEKIYRPLKKGFCNNDALGTGLGLSIILDATNKLGKQVNFTSEYGKGSSFWFYIPCLPINSNVYSPNQENSTKILVEEFNVIDQVHIVDHNNSQKESESHFSKETKKEVDLILVRNFSNSLIESHKSFSNSFLEVENNDNHSKNKKIQLLKPKVKGKILFSLKELINEDLSPLRNKNNLNIIIVDDENLTRLSSIRTLKTISNNFKLKINIIEAEDGIECIYILYLCLKKGIKISLIFSDETMNFMNGTQTSEIIKDIFKKRNIPTVPYFIISAYDPKFFINTDCINGILNKPMSQELATKIIKQIIDIGK